MNYLALGDSYTIGTSVQPEESFPRVLGEMLKSKAKESFEVEIIAKRGWTTKDLIDHLPTGYRQYDIITLLIGVNDLYDGVPFNFYRTGLSEIIDYALTLAGGNPECLRVLSIPDYTFTPFALEKSINVSAAIDEYNREAKQQCAEREIAYVDITDISRRGIKEPSIVADDGLHLSAEAYKMIADRLFTSLTNVRID